MIEPKLKKRDGILLLTIVVGLILVFSLSRWIDVHRPLGNQKVEQEELYLKATTARRLSLGFNGLVADWYWMRSLQYVGGKIIDYPENLHLDNLGKLNLKLLAPLLDASTTLDPQFMEPYQYAAVVLPDFDVEAAIRIIEKGIAANPQQWRLYHNLGFIYWQQKDYAKSGEAYEVGSQLPNAPSWMKAMRARIASEGGSRETARELYRRIYDEAADTQVKNMARKRLLLLDSMDMQDGLRKLMVAYKSKIGRCPATWREMAPLLSALKIRVDDSGAPLDPADTPYLIIPDKCDLTTDRKSEVPVR